MNCTFEESLDRFSKFLSENGYSASLIWMRPKDVLLAHGRMLYVRVPVSTDNINRVRQMFETASAQEKGILFHAFCEIEDGTCCYAQVPTNDHEAERAMMLKELKLSALTPKSRLEARKVTNLLKWTFLKLRYLRRQRYKQQLFE